MSLDKDQLIALFNKNENEAKAIKEDILRACWHMRGGITYDDAMLLSTHERKIINKIVEGNFKVTKESGLPYF